MLARFEIVAGVKLKAIPAKNIVIIRKITKANMAQRGSRLNLPANIPNKMPQRRAADGVGGVGLVDRGGV
jgi:hypothetical protein